MCVQNAELLVKVWFLQKHRIVPARLAGWSERVEEPQGTPRGFGVAARGSKIAGTQAVHPSLWPWG